jgi:hypothetical protein
MLRPKYAIEVSLIQASPQVCKLDLPVPPSELRFATSSEGGTQIEAGVK